MKVLHYDKNIRSLKVFKHKMKTENPDLVHIHGCWSWQAWQAMLLCLHKMTPVVISPERKLMAWHMLHHYWLCKLPKLIIFQRWMLKNAHALVAVTEQEQQKLLTMGLHPDVKNETPWNNRVVLIPDHQVSAQLSEDEMNAMYDSLYQKVVDSHSFMVMNDKERQAESTLLRLGLSQDTESQSITKEQEEQVHNLSPESWRKIMLHADEEGILKDVRKGASLLQLAPMSITGIERFPARGKKNTQPLRTDESLLKPIRLQEFVEEQHASPTDKQVCIVVLNFIREYRNGTLSRRHLADLYTTLRFTDYNEQKVTQILQLLKEKKLFQQLLQILHETLQLEEGFMPTEASNNRGTRGIRKRLYEDNIQ